MDQRTLRKVWLSAPDGRFCPWEQANALGLREASKDMHGDQKHPIWIAERVTKVGGGHPSTSALHQFFKLVDADADWFPGKHSGKRRGPQPLLTAAKHRCIAQSAMAAKRKRREEPCVPAVVHACPSATWNPSTGKVFRLRPSARSSWRIATTSIRNPHGGFKILFRRHTCPKA